MPPSKNSLYRDRIFGDDQTPPKTRTTKTVDNMATYETEGYPFNRDALASTRLNLQHKMWVDSTGYHLHPDVYVPKDALIADIGCGTGLWAVEVAKSKPDCRVEAFDLSLAQAPPKEWCPSNVTFGQLDIFAPIPAHMQGRYDVVTVRLFICVVQSSDPMPLLRNLLSLLRPGGYLQWQETDPSSDKIILADPSASAPKLQALRAIFNTAGQSWIEDFHTRFEEASAKLVAHDRVWTKKNCLLIKQDITFLAVRECCANLRVKDAKDEQPAQLEKLAGEAEEECWKLGRGSAIHSEMVTCVVRKQ
ncbi:Methyltransferase str2 [Fulvia fulva]|nr:Methyltransferase str2 [Fulvia fulva]WPV19011.1 Methyltransferase str2 [Fulvia fulva]WPV33891.1 Methyltransferase str2 [Fulvia fulva]